MNEPRPVFKRNGDVVWMDARLGIWSKDDFWHVYTIAGGHFIGHNRAECVSYIYRKIHDILVARRTLSVEQQQLNINNAR